MAHGAGCPVCRTLRDDARDVEATPSSAAPQRRDATPTPLLAESDSHAVTMEALNRAAEFAAARRAEAEALHALRGGPPAVQPDSRARVWSTRHRVAPQYELNPLELAHY